MNPTCACRYAARYLKKKKDLKAVQKEIQEGPQRPREVRKSLEKLNSVVKLSPEQVLSFAVSRSFSNVQETRKCC